MGKSYSVLGINYGGHDTSAAIMRDGKLVAACEQERYTLDKHSRRFPVQAIDDCLNLAKLSLDGINEVAFAFDPLYCIRELYLRPAMEEPNEIGRLINDIRKIEENYEIDKLIRKKIGYEGPINFYNHHWCHLASTYYPSGFNKAAVVSYDGVGEVETGLIAIGENGNITIVDDSCRYPHSLGLLYSGVTDYLGWRHHCDEGIIMGLASYGNPHDIVPGQRASYYEIFEEIVTEDGDFSYKVDKKWIEYHRQRDKWISDYFIEVFGKRRESDEDLTQKHMNISAALQLRLETIVIGQMERVRERMQTSYLCLSGGIALNCALNGKIAQANLFEEIFVQPASGDAGVAVGACYLSHKSRFPETKPLRNHNNFLGSGFSNSEIEKAFSESEIVPEYKEDIFSLTASKLAQGQIVGWFQGRAEFGPRALGNRSILARPFPKEMKDILNSRVKHREWFRPFAPAILFQHVKDYFEVSQESPHMLIACKATELASEKIPATLHIDDTCRVQTVRSTDNKMFYRLLKAFMEQTGCPVILNTSFNVKGQPIVNMPHDAIACYLGTNIDCLVIGNYFVEKKNKK